MNPNDTTSLQHTLQSALNALEQMKNQDSICHNISKRIQKAKQEYSSSGITGYGGFAIFLIFVVLFLFLFPSLGYIFSTISCLFYGESIEVIIIGIIVVLVHFLLSIVGIVGIVFLFKKDKKCNIEKKEKIKADIKKFEKDLHDNTAILNKIVDDNYEELMFVPEKYRYIHAISAMLDYLNTMRAETMKEAINLYEEEMHRMRMEMSQQQLLAIQNEQQRTLNSINSYTKTNTVLSVINTVNTLTSD